MKVGLAVYGGLSGQSGGYFYDRMMVDHLRRKGDQVEVVAMPGRCRTAALLNGLDPRLLRRLLELDVDVLIEDELCHHPFALLNQRLRKDASYPLIGLFHFLASKAEIDPARAHRLEVMERRFARTLDGAIFNSASTAVAARELAPDLLGVVARPGRDHVQPEEKRGGNGPLRVMFLGSIAPEKGLDVLLKAVALLPRGRVSIEVAGPVVDEAYMRTVLSLIKEHSMEDHVRFWGWVGEQDRRTLLMNADVIALPSTYEGYGLAFVEAMAFGIPSIAPRSGGAGEIIRHGSEGFLIEANDHQAVAFHLSILDRDRVLLDRMSSQAKERYLELPKWEDEMGRARSFLQVILDQRMQGRQGAAPTNPLRP